jgi:hypothetical protein
MTKQRTTDLVLDLMDQLEVRSVERGVVEPELVTPIVVEPSQAGLPIT